MPLTIRQIADSLKISKARVEQWISRKYFRPPGEPALGKSRDWDIPDVMRLAIMSELVDASISPQMAGFLVQSNIYGFKDDLAFFVCWQGARSLPIFPDGPNGEPLKVHTPGEWFEEILRGRDLAKFLANPDVAIGTVICLDNLERDVKAALSKSGVIEE